MSLLILGSIAIDNITTPFNHVQNVLGGSASYSSVAATVFTPVSMLGIIGDDFPEQFIEFFNKRNINLDGVQRVPGETFRWSGKYLDNFHQRETFFLALNVFENFVPTLPNNDDAIDTVLLGNLAPKLQHAVLDELQHRTNASPLIIADTMDFWIQNNFDELLALLKRIDLLILTDQEAQQITQKHNLMEAAKSLLSYGVNNVIIKKGENGALLVTPNEYFFCPSYLLCSVIDPTGAGDSFAGGLAGYLAHPSRINFVKNRVNLTYYLKQAMVWGSVLASFMIEDFSVNRFYSLTEEEINSRYDCLIKSFSLSSKKDSCE